MYHQCVGQRTCIIITYAWLGCFITCMTGLTGCGTTLTSVLIWISRAFARKSQYMQPFSQRSAQLRPSTEATKGVNVLQLLVYQSFY